VGNSDYGLNVKVNDKYQPRIDHEGPERKYKFSTTLSLTSALDWVGGRCDAPTAVPAGRDPVPIV
jgi:hypothetical protein